MSRLELRVVLGLALEIHLPEHVQSRFLTLHAGSGPLGLDGASNLPARLTTFEAERLAVVAGGDDLIVRLPQQALEGQQLGRDGQHGAGRLLRAGGVDDGDAAVVGRKGEGVAAGREGDRVHPARRVVEVLAADGVEGQALAPDAGLGLGVHALDEAGEDARVGVGRAGRKEHRVGVPRDAGDCAADRLLHVLRHPPVVFLLKVADGDDAVARADGKLGLGRRPAHKRRGAADA